MKRMTNIIYPVCTALALVCFAILPRAYAVVPAPDGFYPGFNTAEGQNALENLSTGQGNTAVGWFSLSSVTTGSFNTGVGAGTLVLNSGDQNTATGAAALLLNTTGGFNTANGASALLHNSEGIGNTANGASALFSNTTGSFNTANGQSALFSNTTGSDNTATGHGALAFNTTASDNTATGHGALLSNTTGYGNTANGVDALNSNTIGYANTAVGSGALLIAGETYTSTAVGYNALAGISGGESNIALGFNAGASITLGSNNIDIGNAGVATENQTIRIGTTNTQNAAYIAGIAGQTVGAGGTTCVVDNDGKLGVFLSARRFKTDIADMAAASEALLALRPVTFHYKPELDNTGIPQFGLVAEEVAKVNPDLVTHDAKGELSTVRYEAVNAMLLNEFLKEHHRVKDLERAIARLKSTDAKQEATIANQQEQIEALTAGLQKVSAEIELSKFATGRISRGGPARHPIVNNP
jgi:hypothetical protein